MSTSSKSFTHIKQSLSFLGISSVLFLTACSKHVDKTEDIRPVRVVQTNLEGSHILSEYSGEIRARIESKLGFRVSGKIIARKVDVGTIVKSGQVLMQLDPQDFVLVQAQAKAALTAAESNRDLAQAELKRYQELREKNFVAQAVLEAKTTGFKAAQASYEQAKAAYSNQSNQSRYSTLIADVDGVVTSINAEIGQVVAAGTPVISVAKAGELEVVVGIPEDKVNNIRQMQQVNVRLWANKDQVIAGRLRELSPMADPMTRTFNARVSIPNVDKNVRLGMTASVQFGMKNPNVMIRLPLTALFKDKEVTSVWVVESGMVKLLPVQIGATTEQDVLIASGIKAGQTIVTAGVNLLKVGQKVLILGQENVVKKDVTGAAK